MPRRLLALVLVVLAAAGTAGCADAVSPAIRVGDATVSNDELLDEIDQWINNPVAVDPAQVAGLTPGGYPGELVRQLINQRIDFMLHAQEFERLGLEVTDQLRDQALVALFGDPSAASDAFAAFSEEFASSFTDDVARQIGVQEELGDEGYSAWYVEAYDTADIEVNSRYGAWDPSTRSVTAPATPTPATPTPVAAG